MDDHAPGLRDRGVRDVLGGHGRTSRCYCTRPHDCAASSEPAATEEVVLAVTDTCDDDPPRRPPGVWSRKGGGGGTRRSPRMRTFPQPARREMTPNVSDRSFGVVGSRHGGVPAAPFAGQVARRARTWRTPSTVWSATDRGQSALTVAMHGQRGDPGSLPGSNDGSRRPRPARRPGQSTETHAHAPHLGCPDRQPLGRRSDARPLRWTPPRLTHTVIRRRPGPSSRRRRWTRACSRSTRRPSMPSAPSPRSASTPTKSPRPRGPTDPVRRGRAVRCPGRRARRAGRAPHTPRAQRGPTAGGGPARLPSRQRTRCSGRTEARRAGDEFERLADDHPRITKLVTIGETHQGQDIVALKVTRRAAQLRDGRRPAVLYVGAPARARVDHSGDGPPARAPRDRRLRQRPRAHQAGRLDRAVVRPGRQPRRL